MSWLQQLRKFYEVRRSNERRINWPSRVLTDLCIFQQSTRQAPVIERPAEENCQTFRFDVFEDLNRVDQSALATMRCVTVKGAGQKRLNIHPCFKALRIMPKLPKGVTSLMIPQGFCTALFELASKADQRI